MTKHFEKNPWISILTKPRDTIRAIVDYKLNYRLLILSFIYGFAGLITLASNVHLGSKLSVFSIFILSFVLAPLWGYILFNISAWFMLMTGKLLNGQAKFKEIRLATAWSSVPNIAIIIIWIALMLIFGSRLFLLSDPQVPISQFGIFLNFSAALIQAVASIWILVIYIIAISEVQKFSILRSIGNLILSGIFMAIIFFIIMLACKWACFSFFDEPVLVNLTF